MLPIRPEFNTSSFAWSFTDPNTSALYTTSFVGLSALKLNRIHFALYVPDPGTPPAIPHDDCSIVLASIAISTGLACTKLAPSIVASAVAAAIDLAELDTRP